MKRKDSKVITIDLSLCEYELLTKMAIDQGKTRTTVIRNFIKGETNEKK